MRVILHFLILFCSQAVIYAQENKKIFFEVISEDSVMLYFNDRYYFTEKPCADFIRFTRIDSVGNFNGRFRDIYANEVLKGTGCYINGLKNGYFRLYYPDGQIQSRGTYLNNIPMGRWDYYKENGIPERILMLTPEDTLLVQFYDENGAVQIENGTGKFNGLVAGLSNNTIPIIAKGEIQNGKPNGKWSSTTNGNRIYCKEEFFNGELVQGIFPNALPGGNKPYKNKSFLNTFFLNNYLENLENFRFEYCSDSVKYHTENYLFDINQFNNDLRIKLNRLIDSDIRNNSIENYTIKENYLTIQFSIDKDGKAKDFTQLTSFGSQVFSTIESAIAMNTKFPPIIKTMYFHLKLEFTDNYSYRFNFYFSSSNSYNR